MRLLSIAIAAVAFMAFFEHLLAADAIPNIDESKYVLPGGKFAAPDWVKRRKGAPFPVKEFIERPIDPSKNAAPLYIFAFSQYFGGFDFLYPDSERSAYNARNTELFYRIQQASDLADTPETVNTPETVALLSDVAPLLAMIDEAQKRPDCVFFTGLSIDSLFPTFIWANEIYHLNKIQVASACERDDLKGAEHCIQRTLRLSRDLSPRGLPEDQRQAVALNTSALNSILQHYLPHKNLSVENCDRIINILKHHHSTSPDMYSEGLKAEYVFLGNLFENLETGAHDPEDFPVPVPPPGIINFDLEWNALNQLHAKLLKGGGDFNRIRKAVNEVDEDLERMRLKVKESNESTFGKIGRFIGLTNYNTPVYAPLFLSGLTEFPNAFIRNQARLNGLQMAVAVRRYQLAHGKLPDSLDVAAKEAGYEEVLIDPYDGQKLRFVILDGQPIVYSIGKDRIDQGGKADWKDGEEPGDFLFPVPQPKTP